MEPPHLPTETLAAFSPLRTRAGRVEGQNAIHVRVRGENYIHANYWPIADASERITRKRLGESVRERIAEPFGLPDLRIGLPRPIQQRMADVKWVGEPVKEEEYPSSA
jgi:CubicO group peptidase (beta-lactamase class C family)